jgi:DNA-binding CsgD family transcriptional regulator
MVENAPIPGKDELLERAAQAAAIDDHLAAVRQGEGGRLVLVAGEAGIGKSALMRAFAAAHPSLRIVAGACDALHTPRPLGPFLDVADETGGELAAVLRTGAAPGEVVAALLRTLRRDGVVALVLEDLHWADEATLDALRLLARRVEAAGVLVLCTYRSDELDRTHPLRVALGELPRSSVHRISLAPLSEDGVAALAGGGVDAGRLHRLTGGNPFFVSEVLASGGSFVPDTVRDAVLARAARLDPRARALLDAVAILPEGAELSLLEPVAGEAVAELERCLASGVLVGERDGVRFRHEIARVAVEEALPPDRRVALHRRALAALVAGGADPARLAHHAEAAGDREAVLRHAPIAGERAAALRAHREAAAQYARALRFAGELDSAARADLLDRRSYECYLTGSTGEAVEARLAALDEHRARGDRLREGDDRRWLSRLQWFAGDGEAARESGRLAVELLETLPPGQELAMAYSNMSQLQMLASDLRQTTAWGERAIALAEELGEDSIVAHALNNIGTLEIEAGNRAGIVKLERSLELSLAGGWEEHVARAYTNLGSGSLRLPDHALADRTLDAGIAYCREHDLDAWHLYMSGWKAWSLLAQGHWDEAADLATSVVERPNVASPSLVTPLVVLGLLRARRGDPDPWGPLDRALELARRTGELQRLGPVAAARAEAHWLAGRPEEIEADTAAALELARRLGDRWTVPLVAIWRRRAGLADAETVEVPPGLPYDRALTLADTGEEAAMQESLAILRGLGARATAGVVARALRERGVRDVPQGPRRATRENPAGLTAREVEVLALLVEGSRNAQIAVRLHLSERTVHHHVSAILKKLSVSSRGQAVAEAARLGIVER